MTSPIPGDAELVPFTPAAHTPTREENPVGLYEMVKKHSLISFAFASHDPFTEPYLGTMVEKLPTGAEILMIPFNRRAYQERINWENHFTKGLIEPETYNHRFTSIVNTTINGLIWGSIFLPIVCSNASVNSALKSAMPLASTLPLLSSSQGRKILMAVTSVGMLVAALSNTIKSDEEQSREIALLQDNLVTQDPFSSSLLQTMITGALNGLKRTSLACYLGSGLSWAAHKVADTAVRKFHECFMGITPAGI